MVLRALLLVEHHPWGEKSIEINFDIVSTVNFSLVEAVIGDGVPLNLLGQLSPELDIAQ